jgi:hypothetical protein
MGYPVPICSQNFSISVSGVPPLSRPALLVSEDGNDTFH